MRSAVGNSSTSSLAAIAIGECRRIFMSNIQRRDVMVATAALAASALTGAKSAKAGDPSFMNNAPDPILSGDQLPTFKFALEKGDVGYIPQGFGHSIENVGEKTSRILIGLNSGTYEAIDLSQWIAGNPVDVLATNFAQSPEVFGQVPHGDVFVAGSK
jgi:hypothetical protein